MNYTTCLSCGAECVPHRTWRNLSQTERAAHRAEGREAKLTREWCSKCYHADKRGELVRNSPVNLAVVVEEWNWITDPWRTDRANAELLAPRLGMTVAALEMAVHRGRSLGLVAAPKAYAA